MERGVAAAAGERVDIAGDGALAVHAGSTRRMARLLLLYLGDRPTSDCFVGYAAGTTTFPGGRRGHCIYLQSGQGVDSQEWHM